MKTSKVKVPSPRELEILVRAIGGHTGIDIINWYNQRDLRMPSGTLYITIQCLEKRGWISREQLNPGDRREWTNTTTVKGLAALNYGRSYYRQLSRFK